MQHRHTFTALACAALLAVPAASWAATFTVDRDDNASDMNTVDGVCAVPGGGCTLRAALEQANASPGPHNIYFDFGGTPTTIVVTGTPLPNIVQRVLINGYSNNGTPNSAATGANNADITVRIDGGGAITAALRFHPGASQSTLRGVAITGFASAGVVVSAQGGSSLTDVTLAGNFFGLDMDGTTPQTNGAYAVYIGPGTERTTVGGNAAGDRNLIVSDTSTGIGVFIDGSLWTRVVGNYIGTDRTGDARVNTFYGVGTYGAQETVVEDNVIGAQERGVQIDAGTQRTLLRANRIGVGAGGANIAAPGSTDGIHITNGGQTTSPYNTRIGTANAADGNTIANWLRNGVRAERRLAGAGSFGFLSILGNSISNTGGEGIELVDTATGEGAAPGSRAPSTIGHMPRPVITSVAPGEVNFTLTGGPMDQQARFELFASPACHAGGWGGGGTYLGSASLTDNAGLYSGSIAVPALPAGTVLTMTASADYGPGQLGTSEFSQCVAAAAGPVAPPAGPGGAAAIPVMRPTGLGLLSAVVAGWGALRRRREV